MYLSRMTSDLSQSKGDLSRSGRDLWQSERDLWQIKGITNGRKIKTFRIYSKCNNKDEHQFFSD